MSKYNINLISGVSVGDTVIFGKNPVGYVASIGEMSTIRTKQMDYFVHFSHLDRLFTTRTILLEKITNFII